MLTVESAYGTTTGEGLYDDGAIAHAGLTSGVVAGPQGVRYVFTHWSGDATGTGWAASDDILMDGPRTAVANWKTQYMLDVYSSYGTPAGDGWYDEGDTAYARMSTGFLYWEVNESYLFSHWSWDATGTDWESSDPILMDGPKKAEGYWAYHNDLLYLAVSSAYGTASGEGIYPYGEIAHAGLDGGVFPGPAGTRSVFTGWGGSASGTDPAASDDILMDSHKTALAQWKTEYLLTVDTDHASPAGEEWYEEGAIGRAGLDAGLVPGPAGTRYVFTHWGGDAEGTDWTASGDIVMDAPKTAAAVWKTQHMLTVESDHGTAGGGGWYDHGEAAQAYLDADTVFVPPDTVYIFANWAGDVTGSDYAESDPVWMDRPRTAIAVWRMAIPTGAEIPAAWMLAQNYPNPFNPSTSIRYSVPERSHVSLRIYSVGKGLVRTLVDGVKEPGTYTATWNGTNNAGKRLASGVYFYRMSGPGVEETRKMVLLR